MAPAGKESPPLSLAFLGRKGLKGSPRAYDPPSSHRLSVASTRAGDPYTPFFRSPEVTYRPSEPFTPKSVVVTPDKLPALPPAAAPPQKIPRPDAPRRAYRKAAGPLLEVQKGTLMSPDIIFAKEHGNALPPLREVCLDMLDEGITQETARFIDRIPKRSMLERTGVSFHRHDPMFIEDIVQYQLEHPIPPGVLQKYPGYESFPLLLSRIEHPKLEPNIVDLADVKHLRGHNETMLENYHPKRLLSKGVSVREAYMYVPNFGRVQMLLTDYPDGTSYPLVTLPKMTPYDILAVLEKKKAKMQSWASRFMQAVHRLSCGVL